MKIRTAIGSHFKVSPGKDRLEMTISKIIDDRFFSITIGSVKTVLVCSYYGNLLLF